MQQIIFKTHYLDAIQAGTKTQTTRCWKRKYNMKPGDRVIATNYRRKIPLEIKYIKSKNIDELTLEDAIPNGFATLNEYKEILRDLYLGIDFYNLPPDVLLIGFQKISE